MFSRLILLSSALVLFTLMSLPEASSRQRRPALDLDCKHLSPIEKSYLARHINFDRGSKNLENRTIEQFIKKLDPSKIYLHKPDINKIKKSMRSIFAKTKVQNCKPITDAHELFKKRVASRVKYARSYLGPKFKFDPKVKLKLDPEDRKFPASKAAADRFQKKYMQFQISNYIATDMELEEAKQHVIRNYERVDRRVKEYKITDLWALYLDAFARSLDPHSSYLSHDALEDFEIQMRLSLEGIGATLSSQDGFTVIEQLIVGGAAYRSSQLKPKDKIISVGQGSEGKFENVIEMDLRDVVRLIRGAKGTTVRLTILRKAGKDTKRFIVNLVRDKIKLEDEAAAIHYIDRKVNGKKKKIGLLNLPSFYADNRRRGRSSAKDMKRLLKKAKKDKVDSIVLDLSTNGGGSLDDAVKIAGLFFKTGNVVKQSHRDAARGELVLADDDPAVDYSGPLVVLISRISASASEIVAGTLQDYKRAIVVGGDHTFGKGSVQSVEPLPAGLGALKTTVGMFFIPGGHSTQHRGVISDIVFPSTYSTDEIGEKTLDYSLPPKKLKQFLSKDAYVQTGPTAWRSVNDKMIKRLKEASKKRVAASKEFDKVKENIQKNKKRGKVTVVGELLKDKEEAKKEDLKEQVAKGKKLDEVVPIEDRVLTPEEKHEKYMERADIQEAINIASELISEFAGAPLTMVNPKKEKAAN